MHLGAGETSIVLYMLQLQAMAGITTQHYIVFLCLCLLAVLLAVRNTDNNMI